MNFDFKTSPNNVSIAVALPGHPCDETKALSSKMWAALNPAITSLVQQINMEGYECILAVELSAPMTIVSTL